MKQQPLKPISAPEFTARVRQAEQAARLRRLRERQRRSATSGWWMDQARQAG